MKRYILLIISIFIGCALGYADDDASTLDEGMQNLAERLLMSKQGCIVGIEPASGEIKCIVSSSFYADTINRAVEMEYSPGSTFKVAQALTLVSEKLLGTGSWFTCHKGFWRGKVHIGCHSHRSPLKLVSAIGQSCNSYFCKAFMTMIKNRNRYPSKNIAINVWSNYMHSMGLGEKLGVDIPGEKSGVVPDSIFLMKEYNGRWNEETIMWLGMGQGEIMTTPIQLCNLAASIANRGYYITPHVRRYAPSDSLYSFYTRKHYCKPTAQAYKIVVDGMRDAAVNGTAKMVDTPEYEICCKTGTAENIGDDHSLFIAFAPKEKPEIAVAVIIENGGWGADMAAPMGALMIEQALKGKLSERSEKKVAQWEDYIVFPYDPNFDTEDFKE